MLSRRWGILALCLMMGACASKQEPIPQPTYPTSVPQSRGGFKIGKPYIIDGRQYIPALPASYKVSGISSWYGSEFHNRATANGEIFDKHLMTAAHKTLPLPSVVRVTNINTGQSAVVRVNDRGPFHDNRLIDLSEEAAQALGFRNKGLSPVVVELLPLESYDVALQAGARPQDIAVWKNAAALSDIAPRVVDPYDDLYVQAGVFRNAEAAETLMQDLNALPTDDKGGAKAGITKIQNNMGETLHKVRIGPLSSEDATTLKATLLKQGHNDVSVVR